MASSKVVMLTASLLDLTAFSLALTAEFTRSTATTAADMSLTYNYCVYSSSIATLFGICALLCLIGSQFMKCFFKTKSLKPGCSSACALIFYVISWVSFLEALVFLVIGSVINAKRTKSRSNFGDDPAQPFCETLRKGVFGGSAALIFIAAFTFDLYYVCYSQAMANHELEVSDTNEDDDLKKSLALEA